MPQVEAPTVEDKQEVGLQREETAEGDGLPQAERDASQPPLPPGPEGKPEDESVAQQTDYEDRPRPTGDQPAWIKKMLQKLYGHFPPNKLQ